MMCPLSPSTNPSLPFALLLACIALWLAWRPPAAVAEPSPLSYGPHTDNFGDLQVPFGDGPFPVVVLLHGGFWQEPYKLDLMAPLAEDLDGRGFATWNVEYRRVGASGGGYPETFQDVSGALDFLAEIAADHHLDLTRIALVGHSAGGHLAVWLGSRSNLPPGAPGAAPAVEPRMIVSLAGVLDLVAAYQRGVGGRAVVSLMEELPAAAPERFRVSSPVELVPIGAFVLLIHGSRDRIVPLAQSRDVNHWCIPAGLLRCPDVRPKAVPIERRIL